MPDMIRTAEAACFFDARKRCALLMAALAALAVLAAPARAQSGDAPARGLFLVEAVRGLDAQGLAGLTLAFGALIFAVVTAVLLVRTRERLRVERSRARAEVAARDGEIDRLYGLLLAEPQVIIAWSRGSAPEIIGDPTIIAPEIAPERLMSFASWLRPEQASHLKSMIGRLLTRGEAFSIPLTTAAGRHVVAEGRAIGGSATLRLQDVSGFRKEIAELSYRLQRQQADADAQRALLEALPSPVWTRDAGGRLTFVNPAFAHAVGAVDATRALADGCELLDGRTRAEIERRRTRGDASSGCVTIDVEGMRRVFEVFDTPTRRGSAGICQDVTEFEALRSTFASTVEAHRRTLDQLSTAVAIFDPNRNLAFYNSAYRTLWEIDGAFLDAHPADSAVIDRLRAARRLPEQQDFRAWKAQLHRAYRTREPATYEWHLPDLSVR
jgi:PAS domain-containing protein